MQKRITKSCCGSSTIVIISDKPVMKTHIQMFRDAGFLVPDNYIKTGLFYAKKGGFVATATFGIKNINIRLSGQTDNIVNEFESLIKKIEQI